LIIIAIVILALFGYKKLPDAARAVGRSARILKAETKGLRDDPSPRDLESRAEAEYRRDPVTPPPATTPTPPVTPTPAPSPQPYAEAPRPVHVPPPSETR
jgi:sec-independent protein translocase protein TatA